MQFTAYQLIVFPFANGVVRVRSLTNWNVEKFFAAEDRQNVRLVRPRMMTVSDNETTIL